MSHKEKLELFWKIVNLINEKHFDNKLIVNKICLFEEPQSKNGMYEGLGKSINIRDREEVDAQCITLCHELAHAYQEQILNKYYFEEMQKFGGLMKMDKWNLEEMFHGAKFKEVHEMFCETMKEIMGVQKV